MKFLKQKNVLNLWKVLILNALWDIHMYLIIFAMKILAQNFQKRKIVLNFVFVMKQKAYGIIK